MDFAPNVRDAWCMAQRARLPLTTERIEAARRLYEQYLPRWAVSDAALAQLKVMLPDFDVAANLIRVATLNALYGTNLLAIHPMAVHIADVMSRQVPTDDPVLLVDMIADLPIGHDKQPQRRSFASKFCHFFIDDRRFPIFDAAARAALALHLRPELRRGIDSSYGAYIAALRALRTSYSIDASDRDLDRYLWIAGMSLAFARGEQKINRELLALFERDPRPDELACIADELGTFVGRRMAPDQYQPSSVPSTTHDGLRLRAQVRN